jgi:DNA-binding beta-propeller fold protein YncE
MQPKIHLSLGRIAIGVLVSFLTLVGSSRRVYAELHPGDILVDDFNGNKLLQFSPDGTLLSTFTGPGEQWLGVALTSDGNIVTTTRLPIPHGINLLSPSGSLVRWFATPELVFNTWPGKPSVFADGNIAVPDQDTHVHLYSQSGAFVRTINPPGSSYLVASAVAADDTLWLTDLLQRRLFHLTKDGSVLGSVPVGFTPVDLAIDPTDGTLWVNDQSNPAIHHFDAAGNSLGDIPTFNGNPPEGVSVAADGTLYITTAWSSVVGHVSRTGTLLDSFDSHATGPSFLMVVVPEPSSLMLSSLLAMGLLRRWRARTAR